MENSDKYLLHCSGLYTMLAWMNEQQNNGLACKIANQMIYSHPLAARLFSLGISKNKKIGNVPFFAIQPNENKWFSLIDWKHICIRERDLHLYFISNLVKGNNIDYPDIPPFVFAISFDTLDKIKLLEKIKQLDGREYRMDEEGQIKINFHSKIFSLPVITKYYDEVILEPIEGYVNYTELMRQKEHYLQNQFTLGAPPEFKEDTSLGSSLARTAFQERESFLEKMKKKWL